MKFFSELSANRITEKFLARCLGCRCIYDVYIFIYAVYICIYDVYIFIYGVCICVYMLYIYLYMPYIYLYLMYICCIYMYTCVYERCLECQCCTLQCILRDAMYNFWMPMMYFICTTYIARCLEYFTLCVQCIFY